MSLCKCTGRSITGRSKNTLCFFLVEYAILKDFTEIHRSKILPVTSWQLTNRTVTDISCPSRHSICPSFFPAWIYNMIQIHSGETNRPPRDFVALAQSLHHLMHWSSLRSLLRTYEMSTCSKSILLPILVEVIFTDVICRHCGLVPY